MTEETVRALIELRESLIRRSRVLERMIADSDEPPVVVGMWVGCNDALALVAEALKGGP